MLFRGLFIKAIILNHPKHPGRDRASLATRCRRFPEMAFNWPGDARTYDSKASGLLHNHGVTTVMTYHVWDHESYRFMCQMQGPAILRPDLYILFHHDGVIAYHYKGHLPHGQSSSSCSLPVDMQRDLLEGLPRTRGLPPIGTFEKSRGTPNI